MREIKFRAYIKIDKEVCDVYGLCWNGSELQIEVLRKEYRNKKHKKNILDNPEYFEYWINVKEANLMQYTGIKDIRGRDIYESDIVNIIDNGISYNGLVIKYDMSFCAYIMENDEWKKRFYQVEHIEVIGNIYENPELLEEK